ncbi:hypothetical protein G6F24_018874 [Rhizopus arrhizus]|nr:hypothetical protein G6F24_018874 [Rhizopus arrhizus]
MTEGVIDPLEIVDVGEQQAQPMVGRARGHQPMVKCLAEGQAIGQSGQRIGPRTSSPTSSSRVFSANGVW